MLRIIEDGYIHKNLRKQLVATLKEKGITDEQVLAAIGAVPRHYFLDNAFERIAYEDRAFPIAANQTISQPYTVAYQTQLLQIKKGQKVLEIGTGSMYQTSILAAMGAHVYTIERQEDLFKMTKKFPFKKEFPNVFFYFGDGYEGIPEEAPFHKIIITAAAPKIPEKLWEQLKVGGKMIIPLDETASVQRMMRLTKRKDGSIKEESFEAFSFVPMLEGKTKS